MPFDSSQLPPLLRASFENPEEARRWTQRLLGGASHSGASGETFAAALVDWGQRLAQDPSLLDQESVVAESSALSEHLLAWLASESEPDDTGAAETAEGEEADDGEAEREAIRAWSHALNHLLETRGHPFRFRRILPDQRFDHDRMESLGSESGHHLKVARPLAWIVYQEGDEGTRVLRRGRVLTT